MGEMERRAKLGRACGSRLEVVGCSGAASEESPGWVVAFESLEARMATGAAAVWQDMAETGVVVLEKSEKSLTVGGKS